MKEMNFDTFILKIKLKKKNKNCPVLMNKESLKANLMKIEGFVKGNS